MFFWGEWYTSLIAAVRCVGAEVCGLEASLELGLLCEILLKGRKEREI